MSIKELVKSKQLTAKSALSRLMAKADLNKSINIFRATPTFRWLSIRAQAEK